MTLNKKIAVTGGIGSGKSTFCAIIKEMGFPVFSCDEIYGEMLQTKEYLNELKKLFPDCFEEGILVKRKLAERIFSDRTEKEKLDRLAHPLIMKELLRRMDEHCVSFAEVPLLFEGGFEELFDSVIVVVREREERILSVAARDGILSEQVLARINSQCREEIYKDKKCTVIQNDGAAEDLRRQAEILLKSL